MADEEYFELFSLLARRGRLSLHDTLQGIFEEYSEAYEFKDKIKCKFILCKILINMFAHSSHCQISHSVIVDRLPVEQDSRKLSNCWLLGSCKGLLEGLLISDASVGLELLNGFWIWTVRSSIITHSFLEYDCSMQSAMLETRTTNRGRCSLDQKASRAL